MHHIDYNQEKIQELKTSLEFYRDKLKENTQSRKNLQEYFSLKQSCLLGVNILHYFVSLALLMASIYVMGSTSFGIGFILFSGITFISIAQTYSLVNSKKKLKSKFPNYTYSSAFSENKSLERIEKELKEKISYLEEKLNYYKYQNELNSVKEYFFTDPFVSYEEVKDKKENLEKQLEDYLNEKVDYSNISFDSSIEDSISYSENTKKLIKKWK